MIVSWRIEVNLCLLAIVFRFCFLRVAFSLLPFSFSLLSSDQQPQQPIIVKIVEPQGDPTGLAAVLIVAIGLTGAIVVIAVLLGLVMGGLLFWIRSRSS